MSGVGLKVFLQDFYFLYYILNKHFFKNSFVVEFSKIYLSKSNLKYFLINEANFGFIDVLGFGMIGGVGGSALSTMLEYRNILSRGVTIPFFIHLI